jgi:hypothetical protein
MTLGKRHYGGVKMKAILWWSGPILAAAVGFFAGFIPAVLIFLNLGGLDPAYNLGISDELLTYILVVSGVFTASIAAGLAGRCSLKRTIRITAITLVIASAGSALVFLVSDVTSGFGGGLIWLVLFLTVLIAGVSARVT